MRHLIDPLDFSQEEITSLLDLAARIRRIQNEFPDAEQRRAVLSAQGGTSLAAVFGSLALLFVLGSAFTLLLGPNMQALLDIVSG